MLILCSDLTVKTIKLLLQSALAHFKQVTNPGVLITLPYREVRHLLDDFKYTEEMKMEKIKIFKEYYNTEFIRKLEGKFAGAPKYLSQK